MTTLTDATRVELHPLHVSDDGEGVVGRVDTGTFVSVPSEGLDVILWMQEGLSAGEIRERFTARHGVEPDLADLVQSLGELGFVKSVDGEAVEAEEGEARSAGWQLVGNLPAARVAWLLSRPATMLYRAIWIAVPLLFAVRPDLVPEPSDAVVVPDPVLSFVVLAVAGWLLVLFHELAHMVATRALDCPSFLSVSHRLHFLVAQTDLTALRTRPRRERYGPYLAGMTWDLGVLLACVTLRAAGVDYGLISVVAFLALAGVVFQFAVFMRTDMYFVVSNWLRVDNLIPDTRRWAADRWHRIVRRGAGHDLSMVPPRERRILPVYALLCLAGILVAVGEFVVFGLPVLTSLADAALNRLADGPAHATFWEGLAFLVTVAAQFGVLGVVTVLEWRSNRRAQPVAAAR